VERPAWAPEGIDVTRPSPARVYDYYLGGFHNFAADREMAQQALAMWPELPQIMRANRSFLRRAVTYLARIGITQFLDLGSGIPTAGNVHTVAREIAPDARVAYVDIDPVAVAHSQAILGDDPDCAAVMADLTRPQDVLGHPAVTGLLDLGRPIAVLAVAVLHFVDDERDPAGVLAAYRDAVVGGSHVVISHATHEGQPERAASHQNLYRRAGTPMTMRTHAQVAGLFAGLDLVEPGLVYLTRWRPDPGEEDDDPQRVPAWVGVGHKGTGDGTGDGAGPLAG
jgi:hypothetical protein